MISYKYGLYWVYEESMFMAEVKTEQVIENDSQYFTEMSDALRTIWKTIIYCIVGWAMFCFGIGLMRYDVEVLKTPIMMILGMFVVAWPSLKSLRRGAGIRGLFNYEYIIETTYADGHKTKTSDFSGTLVSKIVLFFVLVALGIIITPIRLIIAFVHYKSAQKASGQPKQAFTSDALFPIVIGLAAFVLMIVLSAVICNIIAAIK